MTLCSWQNDKIQELTKHWIQHSSLVLSRGRGVLCTVVSNSENRTISLRHKAKFVLNCKHKIVTAWNSLKTSYFNVHHNNSICRLSCSQMLLFEESHAWNKAKKLEVIVPGESVLVFKGKLVLWVCTMMHAFSFLIHPHMTLCGWQDVMIQIQITFLHLLTVCTSSRPYSVSGCNKSIWC